MRRHVGIHVFLSLRTSSSACDEADDTQIMIALLLIAAIRARAQMRT